MTDRQATPDSDGSVIEALSVGIGPRPPATEAEQAAAELIADEFRALGLAPQVESFPSQRSFGPTYLIIFSLALLPATLLRRSRLAGSVAGIVAGALGFAESRFARWNPLRIMRTGESRNVWAEMGPSGEPEQTICLLSHMDSSRSGLMFHPRVTPLLGRLQSASAVALILNAAAPLFRRTGTGRLVVAASRLMLGFSAAMILERELFGEDVPGANDNASGVAACIRLAAEFSKTPLERSRLVVLVTGSEESGVIGMCEFLDRHDTEGWLFINFDGVSAEAPLRVLSREGGPTGAAADPELLAAAEEVGESDPELTATPLLDGSGLPYDATPVLQRGGRAITIVNQDGAIPDYHWPTDTADRVSEEAFSRAVRFGAALVRKLDAEV